MEAETPQEEVKIELSQKESELLDKIIDKLLSVKK
jgi:hypothetical protein